MLSASFSRRNCWIKGNAEWRKNSTIQLQEIDLRRIILERIRSYGREERSSFENILILSPDPWTQPGVKNYSTRYHLRPISSTPVILLSNFLHTPPSPYRFLLFRSMARALSTLVVPVVHASMRVDAWKIPPRTRRYVLVLVPKEREVGTLELTGLLPSKIPRLGSFQDDRKV